MEIESITEPNPIPFRQSYWVVPGKLLAGHYPGSLDRAEAHAKLAGLIEVGIRRVVNLQQANERNWSGQPFVPYEKELQKIAAEMNTQVTMIRMPIPDMSVPSHQEMVSILDEIDRSIEQNLPVYVHCWGGHGRTGAVVGCYMARHGIAAGWDALARIKSMRRGTPDWKKDSPNAKSQCDMVLAWKKGE